MKDLTEKLWPAFLAEVSEHLESLELALLGRAASDIADIHAVFRSFHTIKGGCAMMGFSSMEAVAHASEDLLDPLRKGDLPLTDTLVTLLLQVLDCLKAQLAETAQTHREPAPAPALILRLRAAQAGTTQDRPAAGHALPAAAASQPNATPASGPGQAATGSSVETAAALGFAELARTTLPALAATLSGTAALDTATAQTLARLAQSARQSGITAVANLLTRVGTQADSDARIALLGDALDRLAYVEASTGLDCGSAATGESCRPLLAAHFQRRQQAFADAMAALTETVRRTTPATAAATSAATFAATSAAASRALAALEPLRAVALLLRWRDTVSLLRVVAQILREIARGGMPLAAEVAELLRVAGSVPDELNEVLAEDAAYTAMCTLLRDNLQAAAARLVQGNDAAGRSERIRRRLDLHPEVLDTLTAQALDLLEAALERNDSIVEIEADLEATPDFGQEFVAWLTRNGTLISNHTVFHHETAAGAHSESTRLRFLVALRMSVDDVRLMLGDLDPQRRYYQLRACAPGNGASNTDDNSRDNNPGSAPHSDATSTDASDVLRTRGAGSAATVVNTPASTTLRIDSSALDRFVDRVGEMVTLRNMLSHALHRDELVTRVRRARTLLGNGGNRVEQAWLLQLLADLEAQQEQLTQTDVRMLGALGRMQEDVLALRVVPISMVFNRLPRTVRDLSHAQGKNVTLDLHGEDVRIDKGMVDLLLEPLMHMVRNAIDHGIEAPDVRAAAGKPAMATLALSARQQGNTLFIEVTDDGAGLNYARIRRKAVANGLLSESECAGLSERELANLIFLPGFSTAQRITEVSGRGVGMDVVKTRIAQIGGQIDVQSSPAQGVTFILKLPLSVAIQSVVHVSAGQRQLAIPDRNVLEIISIPAAALQSVQGQAACLLRGATLPVYNLSMLLGDGDGRTHAELLEVVVLSDGVYRIGLQVDQVLGRPEVFIRDIHPDLTRIPGVGGASVLGDGRVVIILDCENLFELALRKAQSLRSMLRAS